jgi:hypothetical protein
MTTQPNRHRRTWTLHFGAGPEWSTTQLALAAAHVVAVLLFLFALQRATDGFDSILWTLALVPVLTMSWSGSGAPLALWGLLVASWFYLSPSGAFSWWSLLGAAGVVIGHASTALSASAPPAGQFTRETLARWLRHTALAFAAAVPVALLVAVVREADLGLGQVALVVGLLGLAVGVWLVRSSPPTSPE